MSATAGAELPSVSVVIPVKDDAVALRSCLEVLTRQSLAPLEIVVVDNGSSDDSAAVAMAYGARVVAEPSPGIPAAASTGYDAARGEVIARTPLSTAGDLDAAVVVGLLQALEELAAHAPLRARRHHLQPAA